MFEYARRVDLGGVVATVLVVAVAIVGVSETRAGTEGMLTSASHIAQRLRPALPTIRSLRLVRDAAYGNPGVRVSYCFRTLPTNPWRSPWRLHVAIDNLRDGVPPLSHGWPVRARCGIVIHPAGPIKKPWIVRFEVESKRGTRSEQRNVVLR